MKREHKLAITILIGMAVVVSLSAWVVVALVENVGQSSTGDYSWVDVGFLIVLAVWVAAYVYKVIDQRHATKHVAVKDGFRSIEVKGYKASYAIAEVLNENLRTQRQEATDG